MPDIGVYLYAVTRPVDPEQLKDVEGVSGSPVRVLDHDNLSAVVSTVPLDEFGEVALRANVEHLDWLAATARAHHDVVERAARAVPTAPARLATVFHGDERVHELLDDHHQEFSDTLRLIAGRDEWAVKVYERREQTADDEAADDERPADALIGAGEGTGAGGAYLARRKAQRSGRGERSRRLAERAEAVHYALAEMAVATRRYPPQDHRRSGKSTPMVLNMAYLVDEFRSAEFGTATSELASTQTELEMDISGPWPPYSFIDMEPA